MLASELISDLEELLEKYGDMVVELDSGNAVSEADVAYSEPPYTEATSIVIK
jgi:hypothetical protein